MKYKTAYISGVLTSDKDLSEIKKIYEDIASWCAELGLTAYVPHLKSDPILFPTFTPQEIWKMDSEVVTASDITIAYIGTPSLGVGQELEIARVSGNDIIVWWFAGEQVSRMARGNPAIVAHIEAINTNDLHQKLTAFLTVGS